MAGVLFSCQLPTRSPLNKEKPFPLPSARHCSAEPHRLLPEFCSSSPASRHLGWLGAALAVGLGRGHTPGEVRTALGRPPPVSLIHLFPSFPKGALPAVEPFRKGLNDLMGVCQHVLNTFEVRHSWGAPGLLWPLIPGRGGWACVGDTLAGKPGSFLGQALPDPWRGLAPFPAVTPKSTWSSVRASQAPGRGVPAQQGGGSVLHKSLRDMLVTFVLCSCFRGA